MWISCDQRGWLTGDQRRWLLNYVGAVRPECSVPELHGLSDASLVGSFVTQKGWRILEANHHPVVFRALRSAMCHPASVQVASLTPAAAVAMVEALDRLTDDPDAWLKHAYQQAITTEGRRTCDVDEPAPQRL